MKKQMLFIIFTMSSFVITAQWVQQNSGTNADLKSVFFIDNDNGWAVGDSGVILHSTDGGGTWNQQDGGTDLPLTSVWFADQDRGWIAGGSTYGYSIILRTLNGGNNWDIVAVGGGALHAVCFSDSLTGWAVGSNALGPSGLKSSDGGQTWSDGSVGGYDIYFVDSLYGWYSYGWLNGSTGQITCYIENTVDGGNTWLLQFWYDFPARLRSIFFTDRSNGWFVGDELTIFRTSDGGENWELQNCPTYCNLTGVCFTDSLNGWAVGGRGISGQTLYGVLLKTTNGGNEWLKQPCDSTNNYFTDVCFTDLEHGWITGFYGTIMHTDNGGVVGLNEFQVSSASRRTGFQVELWPNPARDEVVVTVVSRHSSVVSRQSSVVSRQSLVVSQVILKIYDLFGREIRALIDETKSPGEYTVRFDVSDLTPGVYLVRLQAGEQCLTEKMVVMR